MLLSKLLQNSKQRKTLVVLGTILATIAFSFAGELYGNITAFKGSWIDPQDWLAEIGGMTTFLLAEWVFSLLKKYGITLVGNLLTPKVKMIGNKIALYGGIAVVGFISIVSLIYLFKLI